MSIDLTPLKNARRLLFSVPLKPIQGTRFQPTGFPDLGAAVYQAGGTTYLLVESPQSMANRLEAVCWDESKNDLREPLRGLSYVRVERGGRYLTSSITEAHRLNSVYIEKASGGEFHRSIAQEMGYDERGPIDWKSFYRVLLKYDVNSLIHGVFMESISGRLRVPRALSAFIEAEGVQVAASGGVKKDHVQPTKEADGTRTSKEGYGNIVYPREEFTAENIVAYFNVDLSQIRSYGVGDEAERLLILLSLYKIRAFLDGDLRLRTACDLVIWDPSSPIVAEEPSRFELPALSAIETDLRLAIRKCEELGLMNGITRIVTD